MTVRHKLCAALLAGIAPTTAAVEGIEPGHEVPLSGENIWILAGTSADGFATTTALTHGGSEAYSAEMARGRFRMPHGLTRVAGVAAIHGSNIVRTDLTQLEVLHA